MNPNDLDNWFMHHPPIGTQAERYVALRDKAKELAVLFNALAPECADKTAAMRDLRGTVMAMNLAIACNETEETANR